jgi:VIT1/CCC1 family predicted Fe2+/Mn2+ transporter
MVTEPTPLAPRPEKDRSTVELIRDIATDTSKLVRQQMELAKQELMEAVTARLVAAGALAAAGLFAFLFLVFGALAAAAALALVMPAWAAALVVAGAFLLLALPAVLFGIRKMKRPPLKPEETVRTVKEDVEWARAQLKR